MAYSHSMDIATPVDLVDKRSYGMGRLLTLTEIARLLNLDTRNVKRLQKLRNIQPVAEAAFRGKVVGLYRMDQFGKDTK
jgi:hypothetical protein